jgi:hypothetical protein
MLCRLTIQHMLMPAKVYVALYVVRRLGYNLIHILR